MNKCSNCQAEYEGDVCPICNGQAEHDASTKEGFKLSSKAYKVLSVMPTVCFIIFVVLTTVFLALLPVARVDAFGLKEKYGSILTGTKFDEIVGLNSLSLTLLTFAAISIIYMVVLLLTRFSTIKYRGLFGRPLYKLLELITIAFIIAYMIFSFIIINMISEADDGLKIIKASSYPILTIIVSVASLLAIVIAIILCTLHEKACPEIYEEWKAKRESIRSTAKQSAAKNVSKFASKKFIKALIPLAVIVIMVLVGNKIGNKVTVRLEDRPFDAGHLKQLVIKDAGKFELSKYTIEMELGKAFAPIGAAENEKTDLYYTDNYEKLLKKAERNQKYMLYALERGDYRISGLLKQARNLLIEMETMAYGKAEIVYNENSCVTAVTYNNVVIEGNTSIAKKLVNVQVFDVWERYFEQSDTMRYIERIEYLATYTDGSFIYGSCNDVVALQEDGTTTATYEGTYVGKTLKWQDAFGEYEIVAT